MSGQKLYESPEVDCPIPKPGEGKALDEDDAVDLMACTAYFALPQADKDGVNQMLKEHGFGTMDDECAKLGIRP